MPRLQMAMLFGILLFSVRAKGQTDTASLPADTVKEVTEPEIGDNDSGATDAMTVINVPVTYDFKKKYGPNEPNYVQGYTYFGVVVGPSDTGVKLNYGASNEWAIGWRYKRKLSGMFALCADFGLHSAEFNISQSAKNYFLDTTFWQQSDISHKKERFGYYSLALGGFLRVNFDPHRGDYLGHYIDLGATGSFLVSNRYVAIDERRDARVKSKFTGMPYTNPFQYDLTAKLGFNFIALVAKYRMTDIFKEQYRFPEFPRLMLGLEVNSLD